MRRNEKLDSVRGIAALLVVFHHIMHLHDPERVGRALTPALRDVSSSDWLGRFLSSVASGGMAVNIFFILSGAVLIESLRREGRIDVGAAVRFSGRRVFRIFPALIFAVSLFALLSHIWLPAEIGYPFIFKQVVTNSLLLNHGVIGATWTLQSEMLMVPVLLAVAWFRSIFGTIALVGFLFWAQYCLHQGPPFGGHLLNVALTAFALGTLVPTGIVAEACRKMPSASPWLLAIALVAIRFYFSIDSLPALLATLIISAAIVALLYHDDRSDHLLSRPAPVFLGRISYSVYLLHVIVVYWFFPHYAGFVGPARIAAHPIAFAFFYCLFAVPATIVFSALCERYVERPFIRLGAKLFPTAGRPAAAAQLQPAV
jgi:peptidoglycan/LPS O-acetylase OafA/YrhL